MYKPPWSHDREVPPTYWRMLPGVMQHSAGVEDTGSVERPMERDPPSPTVASPSSPPALQSHSQNEACAGHGDRQ